MIKKLLLLLLLLGAPGLALGSAANVYITPSGTGTCVGNPATGGPFYFNANPNWGAGAAQIGPGTMVHLCGDFGSVSGATVFAAQGNGAAGNPITIKFEAGTTIHAPDFGAGGAAIRLDNHSFITVDGGGTGNAALGTFVPNGQIFATLSGTAGGPCIGGPCTQNRGGTGISAATATNVVIKNLNIYDMYLRTSTTDLAPDWSTYFCISAFPGANNIIVDNNLMNDSGEIMSITGNNMEIKNNYAYNTNHGFATGLAGTSYSGAYIHDNHFGAMNVWDAGSPFPYHHDGIHFFQNPGPGFWDNVFVYNNTFDGDIGTSPTGWAYLEAQCCTGGRVYVFNNTANGGTRSAPAEFGVYSGTIFFANNTTWSNFWTGGGVACDIGHSDAITNLWEGTICQGQSVSFNVQPSSQVKGSAAIDFNLVGSGAANGNQQNYSYQGNNTQSLTTWKSIALNGATTHDNNSQLAANFAALNLNSDGTLGAGSPAIGSANNLSVRCNGQPNPGLGALCLDKAGIARPGLVFSKINIDDSATGWNYCWSGGTGTHNCAPGGSGTVTAGPTQTFVNATPSLDGNSEKIAFTGTAFTDVLFYYQAGANNSATYLQGDYQVNITAGNYQDLEFDTYQYLHASLDEFMYGSQCQIGGFWQIWNALTGSWINTNITCSLSTGTYHHITWNVHRIAGDTSCASSHPCMHYDSLTIDGTASVPGCPSVPCLQPAGVLPSNFSDQTGLNFQMDTNSTGGAVSEFLDEVSISGWSQNWDAGAYQFSAGPAITLGPSSFNFGTVPVGSASASQIFTLQNTGTSILHLTSENLQTGTDFFKLLSVGDCGLITSVAPGGNCTMTAEFLPSSAGLKTDNIVIISDASSSPDLIPLTGIGASGATVNLSPATLGFGNQIVNLTSFPKIVHLTNTGGATLNISSIGLATGTQFAQTNTCGATLGAGATCDISITFTPTSLGAKADSVVVVSDAPTSPDSVPLSGTGVAVTVAGACNFAGGAAMNINCK